MNKIRNQSKNLKVSMIRSGYYFKMRMIIIKIKESKVRSNKWNKKYQKMMKPLN